MEAIRCERCGSTDVRCDQVWGEVFLSLGECRRCALRWTRPLPRVALKGARRVETAPAVLPETVAA